MPNSDCEYRVIASFTTNLDDPNRTTWDLTPYQSAGIGTPGGTWRLIEAGAGSDYGHGKIAADGTLVSNDYVEPSNVPSQNRGNRSGAPSTPSGVPNSFTTTEHYEGYMQLQIKEPPKKCPNPEQKDCCK